MHSVRRIFFLEVRGFSFVRKGIRRFFYRLHTEGFRATFIWLYGRGIPMITGIPLIKYSQITPEIFVGAQYSHLGKRKLEQLGFHSSINLRHEFDDAMHDLALGNYCYLPTVDENPPTLKQLKTGVSFIEQNIRHGRKVYIHCQAGMGRAPTMAAAYLITKGFPLDKAVEMIKEGRPFINIRATQLDQLAQFELQQPRMDT
jgi:hypothetical protein